MRALLLKTSLLYYYRFKRGYLCSDEVYSTYGQKADILIDTGKSVYEIEIKTNKADLYKEKKKAKHKNADEVYSTSRYTVNKFSLCVPSDLVPFAKKWIQEVNPKYGLIEFDTQRYKEYKLRYTINRYDIFLKFIKKACILNKEYNVNHRKKIIKRLPSALCNAYIDILEGIDQRERDKNE